MRDIIERLKDIQNAASRILKYTSQGRGLFDQDELVQAWVYQHLKIIGEAAGSIPKKFRINHPEIRWKHIIDMRDALVYRYFDVNEDSVWTVVENDILPLKANIDDILAEQG